MNSQETLQRFGCCTLVGVFLLIFTVLPIPPPPPYFTADPESYYEFSRFVRRLSLASALFSLLPFFMICVLLLVEIIRNGKSND